MHAYFRKRVPFVILLNYIAFASKKLCCPSCREESMFNSGVHTMKRKATLFVIPTYDGYTFWQNGLIQNNFPYQYSRGAHTFV